MPAEGAHLWEWFWTISRRRRSGPEAITYAEVGNWHRLTRTPIRPEEVEILILMDDAFLAEVRKEQQAASERARDRSETKR